MSGYHAAHVNYVPLLSADFLAGKCNLLRMEYAFRVIYFVRIVESFLPLTRTRWLRIGRPKLETLAL